MAGGDGSRLICAPMSEAPNPDLLARRLALEAGFAEVRAADLDPLPVKGVAHDHWRVKGRGAILRVPRVSQLGLAPAANLAYQRACFERAAASGVTPRLLAVIEPDSGLPFGALLVEEIVGRPPALPDDMGAIARAMARVHALPMPPAAGRPPLQDHADPLAGTLDVVRANLSYADRAGVAAEALAEIADELAALEALADGERPPHPQALVLTDTHPGNFLIEPGGRAVAVDLEKMLYGSPAIDLAHASLYTSTRWDPDVAAVLSPEEVEAFYAAWRAAAPARLAAALDPWLLPMRRLTWLRTTVFLMKWLVESAGRGDWSAERLGPAAARHFQAHVRDCLSTPTIRRIRAEWR